MTDNIENGRMLAAEWARILPDTEPGRRGAPLLEHFLSYSGERADIRSTLVDMITDTCLALAEDGEEPDRLLHDVIDMVDRAELDFSGDPSDTISMNRAVLCEIAQELHNRGFSARDALFMSEIHLDAEMDEPEAEAAPKI